MGGRGKKASHNMTGFHRDSPTGVLARELTPEVKAWGGTVGNKNAAKGEKDKNGVDNVNSVSKGGNSPTYALRRLKRDRPDLARKVEVGELSANAAAVMAGGEAAAVICGLIGILLLETLPPGGFEFVLEALGVGGGGSAGGGEVVEPQG